MKRFIYQVLLFSVTAFVAAIVFVVISAKYIDKRATFKIKPQTQFIVVGHSHAECAYNDSLIDNFENYAQSGETYFYSYTKLKKIIEQNPAIQTVFLECSNNQVDKIMDDWTWDESHLPYRYPMYFPFMNLSDHEVILSNSFTGFISSFSYYLRDNSKRLWNKDFNFSKSVGGYLHLVRDKTDSLLKSPPLSPDTHLLGGVSNCNIEYLQKIVDYCKVQKKNLFLIRSPLHSHSTELKNEVLFKSILQSKFSNTEFLDFKDFPLLNSQYGDFEHLNYQGAKIYSQWFNNLLKQGLLEQSQKQVFINKKMTEINKQAEVSLTK